MAKSVPINKTKHQIGKQILKKVPKYPWPRNYMKESRYELLIEKIAKGACLSALKNPSITKHANIYSLQPIELVIELVET